MREENNCGGCGGVGLVLPLLDQGTPSFHHMKGGLRLGVLQGLNLSPWCKPLFGSRDSIMGILGCRQGAGLTAALVPRAPQRYTPTLGASWLLWWLGWGCGVYWTLSLCPVSENPTSSSCSLEDAYCCSHTVDPSAISLFLFSCREKSVKFPPDFFSPFPSAPWAISL